MSSTAIATTGSSSNALKPVNQKLAPAQQQQKPLPPSPGGPQTPRSQTPQSMPQPGTWRHPQMDEIARRQNQATFTSENVRSAIQNGMFFAISLSAPQFTSAFAPNFAKSLVKLLSPYDEYAILIVRLFFLVNFIFAFRPLARKQDDMNDIPLTPSQRQLLGLKPNGTPLTPGSRIMTPPRYSRSATPKSSASDRGGSRSPASGSPLVGRGRSGSMDRSFGQSNRAGSGSPYTGSPLLRESLTGSAGRRLSFDTGGSSSSGLPSTPTPSMGAGRASVALNSKWLYERSRSSPNGRNLFS
ncbi:Nuclear pore complex component-like protein [Elsinoe fawcettii]|nr:Nuclear pore complex component-like protein [Elsinoe fawcettii]